MILLKTLKWDNCFSYGSGNSLDLSENKLVQIIGTNGVGKSSIPLILEEVLYSKNSKGIKKSEIANRDLGRGYSISLEFSKDEEEFRVEVSREGAPKVRLYKNDEDISSHTATNTYKTIQEIIGIEFKVFSQIVYQNINSSLQFLTATDTNRKRFLIELLGLDNYVDIFDTIKSSAKEAHDDLTRVQGRKDALEKWLESNKLETTEVLPLLEEPNRLEETEESLRNLLLEIKNISEKNKKIIKNNELKEYLRSINIDEAKAKAGAGRTDLANIQGDIGALTSDINRLKSSIEKMNRLEDVCHTCEQPIDSNFKANLIRLEKQEIDAKEKLLLELQLDLQRRKESNAIVAKNEKIVGSWESTFRSIEQDLPSELLNKTELEEESAELSAKIAERRSEIDKVQAENTKRIKHNAVVEVTLSKAEETQEELDVVNKEEHKLEVLNNDLEVLKKAFSTNGLIAYKIENLVKELESLTNEYLVEFSDGRFALEFVVSNDKLNVIVTDNGVAIDIVALSSGELARVNTATLIAIRKLMASISKSQINVLFLDEVINALDEQGREKLVEILLEEEDLNTYLVSHGWTHPLLEKLEVTKDTVSKLEKV